MTVRKSKIVSIPSSYEAPVEQPATTELAVAPVEVAVEPFFPSDKVIALGDAARGLLTFNFGESSTASEKIALEKLIKDATKQRKEFAEIRLSFTRGLDAKKKAISAEETELAEPLDSALATAKDAVDKWNREQYRLQLEAQQSERTRLAALAITQAASTRSEAKTADIINNVLQQAAAIPAPVSVPGTRVVKLFEVTNAELVPSEYLVVDETKIREAITAGKLVIPGVKIWEDLQRTGR
jgi:hypothetical protein